jgi:hypothetical protein
MAIFSSCFNVTHENPYRLSPLFFLPTLGYDNVTKTRLYR